MAENNFIDKGCVFNIQKFSLHDGPGIRDLIFMKGCPLRCQWCSNPESQISHPEIAYNPDKCIGFESCGLCQDACTQKAISRADDGRVKLDRSLCQHCGTCAGRCPDRALELMGRSMRVSEILKTIAADGGFHYRSGGGVTIGGGDPMFQADFVEALLRECQNRGIDTAVETAGYGQWHQLEKISRYANLILYDIKCMDAVKHKLFTGVSNKTILRNLIRLAECFSDTPIVVRTPVIPGFNATTKDISLITKFIKSVKTVKDYQLLAYHRLGARKYGYLGKPHLYADASPPDEKWLQGLRAVAYNPRTDVNPG